MNKTAFLDLNGTLVTPTIVDRLADLAVIPGAAAAVAALCDGGFRCVVVTVQSRIGRGAFTESEFLAWFRSLAEEMVMEGAVLEGPYVCPHRGHGHCTCKKPLAGLYERAAEKCGLELAGAVVVGDSAADMQAAELFGGIGCLVRTGWAADDSNFGMARPHAAFVGRDLSEVVDWILAESAV